MLSRVLFTILVVLGATTAAAAKKSRRPRTSLVIKDRSAAVTNKGAKVDAKTGAAPIAPPLVKLVTPFVELHSARVENDLMLFQPALIGIQVAARQYELFGRPKRQVRFFAPPRAAEDLDVRRDRDRMLLFREPTPQGGSIGLGMAMFGATTILSAHAPAPLRLVFDGPVHLGPAVFDGGGMGAGIAGRGL